MKKLFTTLNVLLVAAATMAQVPSYVPTNGLVGYWPFNGNANDESGNGNNGTVNGATLTTDRFGNPNAAYHFEDIGSGMSLIQGNSYLQGDYTLTFWFKTDQTQLQRILDYRTTCLGGTEQRYTYVLDNDQVRHGYVGNGSPSGYTYGDFTYGEWQNVTFVREGSVGRLYVNGAVVDTHTSPLVNITTSTTLVVSSESPCISLFGQNDRRFIGDLDDMGIWSRALTEQEISDINSSNQSCSLTILADASTTICFGDSVQLTANTNCSGETLIEDFESYTVGNSLNGSGDWTSYNGLCSPTIFNSGGTHGQTARAISCATGQGASLSYNFNFSSNSQFYLQYQGRVVQGDDLAGAAAGIILLDQSGGPTYLYFGMGSGYQDPINLYIRSEGQPTTIFSTANLTFGTWYDIRIEVDLSFINQGGGFGLATLKYKEENSNIWLTDPALSDVEIGLTSPQLIDQLQAVIGGFSSKRGEMDNIVLSGCSNQQYQWSNQEATQTIIVSPTQTTTYSVTVTQGGNTCTEDITINVVNPTATITASGATTFCSGGSVTLTASAGSSYLWSNGQTSQSITVGQSGNYSVTVTTNGCSATSAVTSVTVNPTPSAAVTASGPTTFCSGGSVTLTAQGTGSYLWSNGETTQSITVSQSGNYSVTVTSNGCSATSGATAVTVNATPAASITPVGSTTFCQGGFVVLQAAGGGTYQWNTGAQSSSISVSQSGTYVVQVSQNGCTASAQQVVTVNPLPTVTLQPLSNLCQNATAVTLGGGMPMGGTYTVNGTPTNTLDPAVTGSGTQTVGYSYTDNNGCSNSATQSITVNAVPNVTLSGLNTNYALSDAPAQLTGTPTGGVYNGSGVSNGIFDPAAAGLGTHGVSYAVVDGNGCVGVAAFCTTVDINVNIGGSNIDTDGGVNVYPNPSNGQFMLELQQIEGVVSYTVYDARGREVRFGSLVAGGSRTQHGLDLSTEAKGLYTLRLQTTNGTITQKLVKE
jgi:hypothetical protein